MGRDMIAGAPESDRELETLMAVVLRAGVTVSAAVVICGAVVHFSMGGWLVQDYGVFRGEPPDLRSVRGILSDALALNGPGLTQLGVLLLIATPVLRVAAATLVFLKRRDWLFVSIGFVVLLLIGFSAG